MRLRCLLLGSVLSAGSGAGAWAQLAQPVVPSSSCPVSLSVHQRSPTEMVRAGDAPADPSERSLLLGFRAVASRSIVSVELNVRGATNRPRTLRLSLTQAGEATEREQPFRLTRGAEQAGLTRSEVTVTGMTAIRWVELRSVTFADGATWRSADRTACRTEPDRLLLIS